MRRGCSEISTLCRQTADLFAEAGYLVVIPDFFRGTWRSPTAPDVATWAKEQTDWTKLKLDLENIVLPFAKSKGMDEPNMECNLNLVIGGKVFGSVGTCWGSYMVMRMSAYSEVRFPRRQPTDLDCDV